MFESVKKKEKKGRLRKKKIITFEFFCGYLYRENVWKVEMFGIDRYKMNSLNLERSKNLEIGAGTFLGRGYLTLEIAEFLVSGNF